MCIRDRFKPEEVEILHDRMKEAGVQNMSAYIRKMALNGYVTVSYTHLDVYKRQSQRIIFVYIAGSDQISAGTDRLCRISAVSYTHLAGPVAAVLRITGANSVPSVAHPSPPMQVGPAAVVQ